MKTQYQLWIKMVDLVQWNVVSFHDKLDEAKKAAEAYTDLEIKIVEVTAVVNRGRK